MIRCVEELCNVVGCTLQEEDMAQYKVEQILDYLQQWNVIQEYNTEALDFIFSQEQIY